MLAEPWQLSWCARYILTWFDLSFRLLRALLHLPSSHPRLVLQPQRIQVWSRDTPVLALQPGRERAKAGGFGRAGDGNSWLPGGQGHGKQQWERGNPAGAEPSLPPPNTERSTPRQQHRSWRCLFGAEWTGITSQNCQESAF